MGETRQVRRQNERLARKSSNHAATKAEIAEARRLARPNPAPIGLPPEMRLASADPSALPCDAGETER